MILFSCEEFEFFKKYFTISMNLGNVCTNGQQRKSLKGVIVRTGKCPFGWEAEDAASSSFQHASE